MGSTVQSIMIDQGKGLVNAPFSEGEIICQSQQGDPVRLYHTGISGILCFFICPVEGTSIQWQLLPWAFVEEWRRNMRHIWKRNYLLASVKWLHYLLSLEGWGEASPRCFGKADISTLAVIKCKIHGSCLKYLKIQTGQVQSSTMQIENLLARMVSQEENLGRSRLKQVYV